MRRTQVVLLLILLVIPQLTRAKDHAPTGVLCASLEKEVLVFPPVGRDPVAFETGPVGWLYPAPGGVLYAPDLVNGRTTVLDIKRPRLLDILAGVTMPRFGWADDRYVVVAGDVFLFSYPERAPVAQVDARVGSPWVVEQSKDQRFVMILDRRPDTVDEVQFVTVDMITRQVLTRRRLADGVTSMAFSEQLGLLAFVDQGMKVVRLVTPGSLGPVQNLGVNGTPVEARFVADGTWLAIVAEDTSGDAGRLRITQIKRKKSGIRLTHRVTVPVDHKPVGLAVAPGGEYLAVAQTNGEVVIFDRKKGNRVTVVELPSSPRHLVWCDPSRPGPLLPEWSEDNNAQGELDRK
jgi:hypothetical protein